MAIQIRRGDYTNLDADQMLPGEMALVMSGEPDSDDGKGVYISTGVGEVEKIPLLPEVEKIIEENTETDKELVTENKAADAKTTGNRINDAIKSAKSSIEKSTLEYVDPPAIVIDLSEYGNIGTMNNSGIFTETGTKQVKVDIPISEIKNKYANYFEHEVIINIRPGSEGTYKIRVWYRMFENNSYKAIPSTSSWINTSREIIPFKNISEAFVQIVRSDDGDIDKNDAIQSTEISVERLWETGDLLYDEFPSKLFEIESYYNSNMTRTPFTGIAAPVNPGDTLIVDNIKFITRYSVLDKDFIMIGTYILDNNTKTGSIAYAKNGINKENYMTSYISRNFFVPEEGRYIVIDKTALSEITRYQLDTRLIEMDYDAHCVSSLKKYYPLLKDFKGQYDRNNDTCQMISSNTAPLVIYDVSVQYRPYREGNKGDFWIFRDFKPKLFANTIARYGDIVWFDGTALRALRNPYAHDGGETAPNSHYNIVIVGGGAGGIGAAYALCNSGLRVCLIEKENNLGGTHTCAGMFSQIASPIGDWYKNVAYDAYNCAAMRFSGNKSYGSANSNETDFDKLWRGSQYNISSNDAGNLNIYSPYYLYQKYHNDLINGGIEIRYNREFISCKELNGIVISANFRNRVSGSEEILTADYFIDSSGDCYLSRYGKTLDIDYFIGSDAADKYDESAVESLPDNPHYDINTLEQVYLYRNYNASFNINSDGELFTTESPYAEKDIDLPDISGVTKGQNSSGSIPYYNHTEVTPHSTNTSYYPGVCNYVSPDYHCGITKQEFVENGYDVTRFLAENKAKTHYKINRKTDNTYFIETMPMLAIREGYRMKCEYMVTQKDVETTITSENYADKHIVALSSWYVDIHQNTSIDTGSVACTYLNGIPYESMIPCTQKNVLVACRGYGSSHIGLAATRVTKTMLSLGYAAGKAVIQARKKWLDDLRNIDINQLQQDIKISDLISDIETNIIQN